MGELVLGSCDLQRIRGAVLETVVMTTENRRWRRGARGVGEGGRKKRKKPNLKVPRIAAAAAAATEVIALRYNNIICIKRWRRTKTWRV